MIYEQMFLEHTPNLYAGVQIMGVLVAQALACEVCTYLVRPLIQMKCVCASIRGQKISASKRWRSSDVEVFGTNLSAENVNLRNIIAFKFLNLRGYI